MNQKITAALIKLEVVVFDFDGVFTNNQVLVSEDGKESVLCNRCDGMGMRLLTAEKLKTYILSTEVNPVVQARAKKLKLECLSGCLDKGSALQDLSTRLSIPLEHFAFVGNDVNDIEALELVGLGVAVSDAYPEALAAADWVLENRGGYGAVREFCEVLCRVRRDLPEGQSPWLMDDLRKTYAKASSR